MLACVAMAATVALNLFPIYLGAIHFKIHAAALFHSDSVMIMAFWAALLALNGMFAFTITIFMGLPALLYINMNCVSLDRIRLVKIPKILSEIII